ncbi:MAG: hypothetical protein IJP70_02800 [Bacteroidales bacterium]|nr:hypothetical protein [Bacteroidales bacterium]
MKSLATYIEYLLMTRHYAFVPGIGGFMMQEDEARLLRTGEFIPPHRLLKFNRFMDHNDGMLTNVVMRAEGMSYDAAESAIRMTVASLLTKVQHEGRCQLGRLGFIFFDQDCHIAFIASDQMGHDPRYFGLNSLKLHTWQEVENERYQISQPVGQTKKVEFGYRRTDVLELPTRWIRRAAIVLLVLTFFFTNLIPGSSDKTGSDIANIMDTQTITRHFNTLEERSWDENWEQTSDSVLFAAIDAELAEQDCYQETDVLAEIAEPSQMTETQEEATTEIPEAKPEKYYLIIISSCTMQEDAEYQMKRLEKKGYQGLGILPRDGRFRIFINSFAVKVDAETYLNQLRENTSFADAWLLAVRAESLSLIIKNKDNDQLPMELSHLNKSAERDQG